MSVPPDDRTRPPPGHPHSREAGATPAPGRVPAAGSSPTVSITAPRRVAVTRGRVAYVPFTVCNPGPAPFAGRAVVSAGRMAGWTLSVPGGDLVTVPGSATAVVEIAVRMPCGAAARRASRARRRRSSRPPPTVRFDLAVSDGWQGFVTGPAVTLTERRRRPRRQLWTVVVGMLLAVVAIGAWVAATVWPT